MWKDRNGRDGGASGHSPAQPNLPDSSSETFCKPSLSPGSGTEGVSGTQASLLRGLSGLGF